MLDDYKIKVMQNRRHGSASKRYLAVEFICTLTLIQVCAYNFYMEIEKFCEHCGTTIVVSALIFVLATPPVLCEKCKEYDHEPHTHQESVRSAFFNITMSGVSASVFTAYE